MVVNANLVVAYCDIFHRMVNNIIVYFNQKRDGLLLSLEAIINLKVVIGNGSA